MWDDLVCGVDASGEEFSLMLQMAIINHYAYKPTAAELPPGSVFSWGVFLLHLQWEV